MQVDREGCREGLCFPHLLGGESPRERASCLPPSPCSTGLEEGEDKDNPSSCIFMLWP